MPGYGTLPEGEGDGLLPWSWAEERLVRSHDFWLATVTPDGAPHLMPAWAVWQEGPVVVQQLQRIPGQPGLRISPTHLVGLSLTCLIPHV